MNLRFPPRRAGLRAATGQSDSTGQNQVFHERAVGLVTGWYLAQRFEEECYRSERYKRPLSLLLVEPAAGSDDAAVQTEVSDWLRACLRMTDVAAYMGGTRYAVLLPETSRRRATKLAARLRAALPDIRAAVSTFPEDGRNLGELVVSAKRALGSETAPEAELLSA